MTFRLKSARERDDDGVTMILQDPRFGYVEPTGKDRDVDPRWYVTGDGRLFIEALDWTAYVHDATGRPPYPGSTDFQPAS